jgi:hypothetical protein
MRAAILSVALTAVVLSGGAFAFRGVHTAVSVAIGGAIATANLMVFARIGDAFISRKGRTAPWAVIAALKLVILLAGVWLILRSGVASGLALALGYCALPIGITMASLFGPKPPDTDPDPGTPEASSTGAAAEPLGGASTEDTADRDVLEAGRRGPEGPAVESR